MEFQVEYGAKSNKPAQDCLDRIYGYNDLETKIFHRNRINLTIRILNYLKEKGKLKSAQRALDIGCSGGIYSKMMKDFGFNDVLGIDISKKAIKIANSAFSDEGLNFRYHNAEEMNSIEIYDFLLCTEVIEHTKNPQQVVNNIINALKPGGIGVISIPNRISAPFLLAVFIHQIRRKKMDQNLKQHTDFPFYRTIALFQDDRINIIKTAGVNLFFIHSLLSRFSRFENFRIYNRINSKLARTWPLKYFSQFFFLIFEKKA